MPKKMNTEGYDWYYGRLAEKCQSDQDKDWLNYVNRWGRALQRVEKWYTKGEDDTIIVEQMSEWGCRTPMPSIKLWRQTSYTYKNPMNWQMVLSIGRALNRQKKYNYIEALIAITLAWKGGYNIIDSCKEDFQWSNSVTNVPSQVGCGSLRFWMIQGDATIAKVSLSDVFSPGKRKVYTQNALFPKSVEAFRRWGCERVIE